MQPTKQQSITTGKFTKVNHNMAGIYIHIPFCRKACHYCNFHFSTSVKQKAAMVSAICTEAALQQSYIQEPVDTIYFGGGTPSLLSPAELEQILQQVFKQFTVNTDAEITLEANPDDISTEKLTYWKNAGINRLSIGIQSFFAEDLQWMNRAHTAEQAKACIQLAQQAGFNNITIDLIYGTPTLTDEKWQQNVATAVSLNIPHISCYALTVEPKTALDKMITLHKMENVNSETQSRQFTQLMQWADDAGFEHYEISNFAKPGFQSRHNSSYWQGKHYLGLGPSAHSFNGHSRQWNIANNALYIKSIEGNVLPVEVETLTNTQQLNEYIMIRLRTMEGLSLNEIAARWDINAVHKLRAGAEKYLKNDMMVLNNNSLILTRNGRLFADGIAADLFC